jgi:hypothetical protein
VEDLVRQTVWCCYRRPGWIPLSRSYIRNLSESLISISNAFHSLEPTMELSMCFLSPAPYTALTRRKQNFERFDLFQSIIN